MKLTADAAILFGLTLIGHGIYRLSPIAAEFYAGAIAVAVGVLVIRK